MRFILVATLLTCLACLAVGLVLWHYSTDELDVIDHSVYSDRLYLSADEYEDFKMALADKPEVSIDKLEALSSPNTLLDFRITAPEDTTFPYGERTIIYKETVSGAVAPTAFVVIMTGLAGFAIATVVYNVRSN